MPLRVTATSLQSDGTIHLSYNSREEEQLWNLRYKIMHGSVTVLCFMLFVLDQQMYTCKRVRIK